MNLKDDQHRNVTASIVIPVYNRAELTAQCIAALLETTRGAEHEIIVVDNASSDGTAALLSSHSDRVRAIRNRTNLGFAKACNQGAGASRGKYIVFLNNDTIPLRGWLDALIAEAETNPGVAAVGSKLLYENGTIQHAGVIYSRQTRFPHHPYRFYSSDDKRVNRRREMQAVTAACMLVRREAFSECEGFDEGYRNGWEDLDFCVRLRLRKWTIVYQPESVLYHLESQTQGRMQHDNENVKRFFDRWKGHILEDEDAFFLADGLKRVQYRMYDSRFYKLTRITSEKEMAQWRVVADLQVAAAQGEMEAVRRMLLRVGDWPMDPSVRYWAGLLCLRLGLEAGAIRHWQISLELDDLPEVRRAIASLSPVSMPGGPHMPADCMLEGQRALKAANFQAAADAFDKAFLQGVNPEAALSGLAEVAIATGDMERLLRVGVAMLETGRADETARAYIARAGRSLGRELPRSLPAVGKAHGAQREFSKN